MLPIAIQLYSVRDDAAADMRGTLQKIREMGYDGVEFAGLHQRIRSQHGFGSAQRLHEIDVLAQHCYRAYSPLDDIR